MTSSSNEERKARPIYDAIDCQNYKGALNLCNKLLKKSTDSDLIKALKALSLDRMGRSDEALQLCEELSERRPSDMPTLYAMLLTFRSNARHDLTIKTFESAVEKDPTNEEIMSHLFMAHVRANDFKGQQQVAMKLIKQFKNNPRYIYWNVMSLVLMAEFNSSTDQEQRFSLTLAERILKKCLDENRVETVEQLKLLFACLQMQEKHKETLDTLNGEWGERMKLATERDNMKIILYRRLGDWPQVQLLARSLLDTNIDSWDSYMQYFDSLFSGASSVATAEMEAREFVAQQLERNGENKRGPWLAELELEKRIGKSEIFLDRLVGYYQRFGAKLCCFADMRPYLALVSESVSETDRFMELLKAQLADSDPVKIIARKVCLAKIERALGLYDQMGIDEIVEKVDYLHEMYTDALEHGKDLLATEVQLGDDFMILAAHALHDCFVKSGGNLHFIWQAVVLLEDALSRSRFNFQFKILLIRFYMRLGVFLRAQELFATMEVKHVILDSLGYIITDSARSFGFNQAAEDHFDTAYSIYKSNWSETPEMICTAYTFGTYSKIAEFVRFGKRLDNSIQRRILLIEDIRNHLASQILTSQSIAEVVKVAANISDSEIKFSGPSCDNRDFSTQVCFNPPAVPSIEQQTRLEPLKNDNWIAVYSAALRALKTICQGEPVSVDALSELEQNIKTCSATAPETYCISAKFMLDTLRSEENIRDLHCLLPALDETSSGAIDCSILTNTSLVLEALMFQRMVLHCRKHKSDAHAAQLASRLLEWLQAQTNRLTGDEQVFPTETFSNEPLADAMLPIAAFLVDQKSADFIQDLFKRQIVSSWVQSFKQFEKMCRILIN